MPGSMVFGPRRETDGSARSPAATVTGDLMLANGLGLIALFSLFGVLFVGDRRDPSDPRESVNFWTLPYPR